MGSMKPEDDDEIEHIDLAEEDKQPASVHQSNVVQAINTEEERRKLKRTLLGILLVGAMLTVIRGIEIRRWIADFLAVFFVTFAAFKFSDIEAFAQMYRNYDWLAKRIRPWAYILPFIQAFLGFYYLLSDGPRRLDIIALVVTGTATIPAIRAYHHHFKTQYAYHKVYLRLPFTKISMIESVTTFILSGAMLVLALIK
jgi:hypothetical protein